MKKFLIIFVLFPLFFSCSSYEEKLKNEKQEIESNIARLEKILLTDTTGNVNITVANEIIKYYAAYSYKFQNDSITPEYIFRMANVFEALGKYREAIEAFHKVETKYPDYPKKDICIFMQGNIYETELNDLEKARQYYERYLQSFPNKPFAKDVKILLENLGKSPEELLKSIQKNNSTI